MTLNLGTRLGLAGLVVFLLSGVARGNGDGGHWEKQATFAGDDFASNRVTALARDEDNVLWVGTDRTLVWTADNGRTWQVAPLERARAMYGSRRFSGGFAAAQGVPAGETLARRHRITSLAVGRKGIWVGTLNGLCLGDVSDADRKTWYTFPVSIILSYSTLYNLPTYEVGNGSIKK